MNIGASKYGTWTYVPLVGLFALAEQRDDRLVHYGSPTSRTKHRSVITRAEVSLRSQKELTKGTWGAWTFVADNLLTGIKDVGRGHTRLESCYALGARRKLGCLECVVFPTMRKGKSK